MDIQIGGWCVTSWGFILLCPGFCVSGQCSVLLPLLLCRLPVWYSAVLLYEAWMCTSIILLQRCGIMGSFGLWLIPFTFAASRKSPGSTSMHSVWPFFLQGPGIPTTVSRAPLVHPLPPCFLYFPSFGYPGRFHLGYLFLYCLCSSVCNRS